MVFLCSSKSIFCYATYDGFLVLPEPPLVIVSFFVATGPGSCCEMPAGLAFEHTSDDITMKYCTAGGFVNAWVKSVMMNVDRFGHSLSAKN